MGAVAISRGDEGLIESLQKTLDLPSKSQVIHQALQKLRESVERENLVRDITRSVKKCSQADLFEHSLLTGAAAIRLTKE